MAIWSRQKFFKLSKGYYGRSKNCFRIALRRVFKSLQYQYRDRRVRRRDIRTTWIRSINAAVRDQGIPYSRFVYGLNRSNMELDRKILSDLAQNEPYSFKAVVDEIKCQVQLPCLKPAEFMTYQTALDKKLLHFNEYVNTPTKDIEFRFAKWKNPNEPDWYGLNRPDFPSFYLEQRRKSQSEQMPEHEMKKLPFTAMDDIPSDPDDE
jgi:large subunit ribosomal protein L20